MTTLPQIGLRSLVHNDSTSDWTRSLLYDTVQTLRSVGPIDWIYVG